MPTELIEYSSAANMVNAWESEMPKISAALQQIGESLELLNNAFQAESYKQFNMTFGVDHGRQSWCPGSRDDMQGLRNLFHRRAWEQICRKIEIRKLMSSKRAKELDEQLEGKGEALPALTLDNIIGVVNGFASGIPDYLNEVCAEVYESLVGRRFDGYKTNKLGEIGSKRIIEYAVDEPWRDGTTRVNYSRQQMLNSISNVFALLDGKGPSSEYMGELVASINSRKGSSGETTYFKWKAFKNRNLHLEFKRLDLVEELVRRCANRRSVNDKSESSNSPGYELACT